MAYQDENVLASLEVDRSALKDYEEKVSIEQSAMSTWLDKELFTPIDDAGAATTQEAYEAAYDKVFEALSELNASLGQRKYLTGDKITDADIRLYSVLVRFDSIFFFAYRLNRHKITHYRNLFHYAKKLYHMEAFKKVTDFEAIKRSYYEGQTDEQNPYHIVMIGPDMSAWD